MLQAKSDSKWGSASGPGKDPHEKRIPRTWGKRKTSAEIKPFEKLMSKKENKNDPDKQALIDLFLF
jgi:hypothetical protein